MLCLKILTNAPTDTQTPTHTHTHIHTHPPLKTHSYTLTPTHTFIHTHTYTQTPPPTHTQTHIHRANASCFVTERENFVMLHQDALNNLQVLKFLLATCKDILFIISFVPSISFCFSPPEPADQVRLFLYQNLPFVCHRHWCPLNFTHFHLLHNQGGYYTSSWQKKRYMFYINID